MVLRPPVIVATTDVDPVTPGGLNAGWVSGSLSGLAPSTAFTAVFDLGPNWSQYALIAAAIFVQGPASGLQNVVASGSAIAAYDSSRRLNSAFSTTYAAAAGTITAGESVSVVFRPMGRYFAVKGANADAVNALGSGSEVTIAAYPS
jgi:hypothetical protein